MAHREIIEKNLTALCELTTRLVSASESFYSRGLNEGILNSDEYTQLISSNGPRYAKSMLFYHFLYVKESDKILQKLVQVLESFPHTSQILQILGPKTGTEDSRRIKIEDVHWIALICSDDEKIIRGQEMFFGGLGLKPAWFFPIKSEADQNGNSTFYFFYQVLTKWIGTARTPTTFGALDKLLREMNFHEVADAIVHHPRFKR